MTEELGFDVYFEMLMTKVGEKTLHLKLKREIIKRTEICYTTQFKMDSLSANMKTKSFTRRKKPNMLKKVSPSRHFLLFIFILLIECHKPTIRSSQSTFFVSAAIPVSLNRLNQKEETDSQLIKSVKNNVRKRSLEKMNLELKETQPLTINEILIKAGKRGIGGGIPGAVAGVVQVLTMMWLRTIINYQYRYGTSFKGAFRTLYNDGGFPRFYRGVWFALIQAPLARFASTAANDSVESLLASFQSTKDWGPGRGTVIASIAVGVFRILLMPIDTCKVVLQVDSIEGLRSLMRKVKGGKINLLYSGALAQATSAIISHFPWFYTFNFLSKNNFVQRVINSPLLRNAAIGFIASLVSDTISNSIRVIKTTKQAVAAKHSVSYGEAISMVLAADGWSGLFGRGLKSRIIANGIQSVIFTIIWRGLTQRLNNGPKKDVKDELDKDDTQS